MTILLMGHPNVGKNTVPFSASAGPFAQLQCGLQDANCESDCNFCPYSGTCGGSSGREKLYVVNEEEEEV